MNLTPWFPHDVKPVHMGVYEVDLVALNRRFYAHWDGRQWGWWATNPATAAGKLHRQWKSTTLGQWRGIAAPIPQRPDKAITPASWFPGRAPE